MLHLRSTDCLQLHAPFLASNSSPGLHVYLQTLPEIFVFVFSKSFGILPFVHCTHSTSHNQNPGQETLHFLRRLSQNLSLLLVKRNIKNKINRLNKLTCHLQHYVGPRVIVNCPRSIVYSFEASDWC